MCLMFYFMPKAVKYPTYLYKPVNIQSNKPKPYICCEWSVVNGEGKSSLTYHYR